MNNSAILFLINDDARAITGHYELKESAHVKSELFKTLDQTVQVGDFVVVESSTRHHLTVVKVDAVDVDINFDDNDLIKWMIQKIDTPAYHVLLQKEQDAITAVQRAERKRKRAELQESLFQDHGEAVKQLELSTVDKTPTAE